VNGKGKEKEAKERRNKLVNKKKQRKKNN